MDIQQQLLPVIAEHLGLEEDQVQPQSSFEKDLGVDSLDSVAILMAVNEAFKTRFTDKQFAGVDTVQQLIDLIKSTLQDDAVKK